MRYDMCMVKICAIGAASQDVYISGKGIKSQLNIIDNEHVESLRLGSKLTVDNLDFASGGGATNAAVTFARQGLNSSFIGKLSNDLPAQGIIADLDKENIDSRYVIYDDSRGTQYSTVLLAESGERTVLVYRGISETHRPQDYEQVDFSQYDWLYVTSFGGAMEALDYIFQKASAAGVKIAFNPGDRELNQPDKLKPLLEDVAVLLVNKEEAQKIVEGEELEELTLHLLHYVPTAIISDGPNGVVASDGRTLVRAGMYEDVKVIDRTGAGDAFGSGFVSQWALGKSLKDSVIFASANSTSVVTKIGAKAGILYTDTLLHDMPINEKYLNNTGENR